MGEIVRPLFERRRGFRWPSIIAALAAGIALVLAAEPTLAPLPTVTRPETTTPQIPQKIFVIDGDTVRMEGTPYRLVDFNTPESGMNAQCTSERALSAKATKRLQELLLSGEPYLQRVPWHMRQEPKEPTAEITADYAESSK